MANQQSIGLGEAQCFVVLHEIVMGGGSTVDKTLLSVHIHMFAQDSLTESS